jgi:hypothetical protein
VWRIVIKQGWRALLSLVEAICSHLKGIGRLKMNINNVMKSVVFSVVLLSLSGLAMADGGFPARISAQIAEINKALSKSEIDSAEGKVLTQEMQGISRLFTKYYADKKLTAKEVSALDAKLKDAEVNLFRKKYD